MPNLDNELKRFEKEIAQKDPVERVMAILEVFEFAENNPSYRDQAIVLLKRMELDPNPDVREGARNYIQTLQSATSPKVPSSPPSLQKEIRIGKTLAYFPMVKVSFSFHDVGMRWREIKTTAEIGITKEKIYLVANDLSQLLARESQKEVEVLSVTPEYHQKIDSDQIIVFTEQNFVQIVELAENRNLKWEFLMNLSLSLPQVAFVGFGRQPPAMTLFAYVPGAVYSQLLIFSEGSKIAMELEAAQTHLEELANVILEHGKK